MSETLRTTEWSEPTYHGVPVEDITSVQAQHDQLVMKWQEARATAGEEDETAEFYAEELTELLRNHPELYPETDQN